MKRGRKALLAAVMAGVLTVGTSGCGVGFTLSPDELYRLPKLPAEYTELDKQLSAMISAGAEYAPPSSGTNIQSVQLTDLNGDGHQEALAFLRVADDEKPLKVYIFTPEDETYRQTAVIEGTGTGFYSVSYTDMDGDGYMELLVGWKVNAELQALTVYSLANGKPEELMRSNYVKYALTNLNRDEMQELVVIRADEDGDGTADYYRWQDMGLVSQSSARISSTMAQLSQQGRLTQGTLLDGTAALFVTGVTASTQAVTDILTEKNGELTNISLSDITGVSSAVYSFRSLYPMDINHDDITEIPWQEATFAALEETGGSTVNPYIEWRSYDSGGDYAVVQVTCHNTEDGWYLRIPAEWENRVLVRRSVSGEEAAVTFSYQEEDGTQKEFLRITAITGTGRESKAARSGRFILSRQAKTIYTAELLEANQTWKYGVTEDDVREAFSLIDTEWISSDY